MFLFREDHPYRVENGRAYYDWNLVLANDYGVFRAYREPAPHNGGDDLRSRTLREAKTAPNRGDRGDHPADAEVNLEVARMDGVLGIP